MSNYLYLTCEAHNPPLRAENESGQHYYDLPRIRDEIKNRKEIARIEDEDLPCGNPFIRHSAHFLSQHKECGIGIVDEYGQRHSIEQEPDWVFRPASLPITRMTIAPVAVSASGPPTVVSPTCGPPRPFRASPGPISWTSSRWTSSRM